MKYSFIILCLCLAMITSAMAAPDGSPMLADSIAYRLQLLEADIQSQMDDLTAQLSLASSEDRPELEQRVAELKRQGEIRRLTILLEAAQTAADLSRVREIERALEQWRNPTETRILPDIEQNKPANHAAFKSAEKPAAKPVHNQ